jgi:hypothetical protein
VVLADAPPEVIGMIKDAFELLPDCLRHREQ